jgi:Family of unknown function (DUF5990)
VLLTIHGHDLPGRTCGSHRDVHVGIQLRGEPTQLVPADQPDVSWTVEIDADDGDFRGPAVHGKRGERFVYLTWGELTDGTFSMFRRAKLMLADLPPGDVTVDVHLTDDDGLPRCARLRPPALAVRATP